LHNALRQVNAQVAIVRRRRPRFSLQVPIDEFADAAGEGDDEIANVIGI